MNDARLWRPFDTQLDNFEQTWVLKGSTNTFLVSKLLIDCIFRHMTALSYPYINLNLLQQ